MKQDEQLSLVVVGPILVVEVYLEKMKEWVII